MKSRRYGLIIVILIGFGGGTTRWDDEQLSSGYCLLCGVLGAMKIMEGWALRLLSNGIGTSLGKSCLVFVDLFGVGGRTT